MAVNQTNQALTEAGPPQDEIDPETIPEWKTLRRNLAFANAALSISNAEQFVDNIDGIRIGTTAVQVLEELNAQSDD